MADICTLVLITTMNAVGCVPATTCYTSADGTKEFCGANYSASSPSCMRLPAPIYECHRADGTIYTVPQSEAK